MHERLDATERQEVRLAIRAALEGPVLSDSSKRILSTAYAKLARADGMRFAVRAPAVAGFSSIGELASDIVDRLAVELSTECDHTEMAVAALGDRHATLARRVG